MYSIQVRALLEHQTVFWRPHLWKTLTHPASPEGSSVDGGGKVLDISSIINLLISQMDLSLFSLEWWDFPGGSEGKQSACNAGGLGSIPGLGRSSGEGRATHSSILAWRSPWTEEPGRLQSLGSQRVRHNWETFTHYSLEWQRLWGMRNAGLKYLSGHQGNSVVHLAYLSREQISNDWMGIPGSRPGPFPRRFFLKKIFTQG